MTKHIQTADGLASIGWSQDIDGLSRAIALHSTIVDGVKPAIGRSVDLRLREHDVQFLLRELARLYPDRIVALGAAVEEADRRAQTDHFWLRDSHVRKREELFREAAKPTYTADEAVKVLAGEGHDRADVDAAFNSLVDSGLDLSQPGGTWVITTAELEVLREQLTGE